MTSLAASFRDGRSARRQLLDYELEALVPLMRGRVLEIGNGHRSRRGAFRPPLQRADAWVYVDLDVRRAPDVCGDAQALPFGEGEFDTVVCLEVLEYVPRPQAALNEITRVLRQEGSAIISTPFNTRPDATTDFWRFTSHGLQHLVTAAGLDVTRVSEQGSLPSVILHMLRVLNGGPSWRRRIVAWTTTPGFRLLLALDRPGRRRGGDGSGYTTGYVLVATKSISPLKHPEAPGGLPPT